MTISMSISKKTLATLVAGSTMLMHTASGAAEEPEVPILDPTTAKLVLNVPVTGSIKSPADDGIIRRVAFDMVPIYCRRPDEDGMPTGEVVDMGALAHVHFFPQMDKYEDGSCEFLIAKETDPGGDRYYVWEGIIEDNDDPYEVGSPLKDYACCLHELTFSEGKCEIIEGDRERDYLYAQQTDPWLPEWIINPNWLENVPVTGSTRSPSVDGRFRRVAFDYIALDTEWFDDVEGLAHAHFFAPREKNENGRYDFFIVKETDDGIDRHYICDSNIYYDKDLEFVAGTPLRDHPYFLHELAIIEGGNSFLEILQEDMEAAYIYYIYLPGGPNPSSVLSSDGGPTAPT